MVQCAGGRLEPAGDELVHEVLELGDRQRFDAFFVLVGVDERGDEVVGGLGSPGLEHRREMVLGFEFDLDGLQHLVVGQRTHRQCEHGARPAVEAVDLGAVETEFLGDDDAR